jgi:hypothetical protein
MPAVVMDRVIHFAVSLLPWSQSFNSGALVLSSGYVAAQILFCLALRRMAMAIPGPQRMCNPLGLWVLAVPLAGAVASFGVLRHVWEAATAATEAHHVPPPRTVARAFAVAYGASRLLILVPGMLAPALVAQVLAATGFLLQLGAVARSLRTADFTVARLPR